MIPVLLDTDIGNDIDDAVALAYLLRQPACELVGITTVTGQARKRAALAEVICRSVGREDIPIHCGREETLSGPGQPNPGQYEMIRDLPHRMDWPLDTAAGFLEETIRSRPGEIVLLSIGPFTNLALLDPSLFSLLKGFVSMAGVFFQEGAEWNCRCDPLACASVYSAPRPTHVSVGLDVTMPCRLSALGVRSRFVGEPLGTVARIAEHWFQEREEIVFHDPLAAACIFNSSLCAFERGRVSGDSEGRTSFVPGEGPDMVASRVDVPAFFDEFFSVF